MMKAAAAVDSGNRRMKNSFELCKVCRINHDQGRRHNYFSAHINNLSIFFSRCLLKHSRVILFLRSPSLLHQDVLPPAAFWCAFCEVDIQQIGSPFSCGNAIKHLASMDHLKSLKNFLWKNGCGMDRVDSLRISEDDLLQWEIKCKLLKSEDATTTLGSVNPSSVPTNHIHNEFVTNERNQISVTHQIGNSQDMYSKDRDFCPDVYCVSRNSQDSLIINGMGHPTCVSLDVKGVDNSTGETSKNSHVMEEGRNVHSGEPPLWLSASEVSQIDAKASEIQAYGAFKGRKSRHLNPKRVGAAWADKRKLEMEMQKKGQLMATEYSDSWLPNFGRVWQSGSRKESRREFEAGSQKVSKRGPSPSSLVLQPYVSKRMRRNTQESEASLGNMDV